MLVKDLMSTKIICVKPDSTVSDVADLLHEHGITGVPVINDDATVLGLITEKELFSADSELYLPGYLKILQESKFLMGGNKELPYAAEQLTRTSAKEIMNRNVFFTTPEKTIEELADIFIKHNQSPIPVTDSSNKLVGIISRSDLIKLFVPKDNIRQSPNYVTVGQTTGPRPIDEQLSYVHKDLNSRFAFVAKARANVWLTAIIVLFVIGFLVGVIYVADPSIIGNTINGDDSTGYNSGH